MVGRRRRGGWRFSDASSLRQPLLGVIVVSSVLALGTQHVVSLLVVGVLASILAVLSVGDARRWPPLAWFFLGWVVITALQLVPLPSGLLARLSPAGLELWQSAFGGREAIVGQSVEVDGVRHEVIGVMPRGFDLMDQRVELWLPLQLAPAIRQFRASHFLSGVGRLKDGVTPPQACVNASPEGSSSETRAIARIACSPWAEAWTRAACSAWRLIWRVSVW